MHSITEPDFEFRRYRIKLVIEDEPRCVYSVGSDSADAIEQLQGSLNALGRSYGNVEHVELLGAW